MMEDRSRSAKVPGVSGRNPARFSQKVLLSAPVFKFLTIASFLSGTSRPEDGERKKKKELKRKKPSPYSAAGSRSVNIDIAKKTVDSRIGKLLTLPGLFS